MAERCGDGHTGAGSAGRDIRRRRDRDGRHARRVRPTARSSAPTASATGPGTRCACPTSARGSATRSMRSSARRRPAS